jgi:Fic family protein
MFRPRYRVSPPLLAAIKRITIQVHELNKQHLTGEVAAELGREAAALAAAAATDGDEQAALTYGRTVSELAMSSAADLNLALLLRIHYRLSRGVLPDEQLGRLRRETTPAGDPESDELPEDGLPEDSLPEKDSAYWPPEAKAVPVLLSDLMAFVEANQATLDPLLLAGIFHRRLLLIRPFAAGNGSTAWLATRVLLSGMGLKRFDLLAMEECFRDAKTGYLAALGVRGNFYEADALDFTTWLEYFAGGVSAGLSALERRQRKRQATPATTLAAHHLAILAHVDEHGFITDKEYGHITDRAKATRSLDFKKLLELDLLVREGKGRGTFYRRKP